MGPGRVETQVRSLKIEESDWLTVPEAARYLHMPEGSLRNRISDGRIPSYKPAGRVLVRKSELETLALSTRRGRAL
jgi:excisionase family DNA binding protein